MAKKLGFTEFKKSNIILQLADRSVRHPRGIAENVLVKIEKFSIPVNFEVWL